MTESLDASHFGSEALRLLCAELNMAAALLDSTGRVLFASPRLQQWLNLPSASLVGRPLADLPSDPFTDPLATQLPRVLRGERTEQEAQRACQGRQLSLRLVGVPLRDERGQVHAALFLALDTTTQRQAEEERRQMLRLETVSRQAGGLVHDLNNLLGVVVGHLELLRHARLEGDQAELLAQAQHCATLAGELVKQCLTYLRLGRSDLRLLDLNARVAEAPALMGPRLTANIRLDMRLSPSLPPVLADPGQLTQAILNLCLNACDAMPAGGTLLLETEEALFLGESTPTAQRRAGRFVCLHVGDTGQGMTPEVQARIFEPFFTTKQQGQGTGMGLAIVQGVAQQHHGWVECVSTVGLGTRFSLYLPAAPPSREGNAAHGAENQQTENGPAPGSRFPSQGPLALCLP